MLLAGAVEVNTLPKERYGNSLGGCGSNTQGSPAADEVAYARSCAFGCDEAMRYFSVHPAVIIRQSKAFRRKHGLFIHFEDNAGVIVNNKGEMKGKHGISVVDLHATEALPQPQVCCSNQN